MKELSEFGGGIEGNRYCRFCTYEDGELKEFEVKLKEMAEFVQSRMNVDASAADRIARENMAKMPAWREYF